VPGCAGSAVRAAGVEDICGFNHGRQFVTAKEYLSQLGNLNRKIDHKKLELVEAELSIGISRSQEGERVQTLLSGSSGDQPGNQAIRILLLKEIIDQKIIEYMEMKDRMIDQIHDLQDGIYIDILYRRYVRDERNFAQIACDMGYSYKYVINKHGEALLKFERIHPELFPTGEHK
jgi:hypothetical protein